MTLLLQAASFTLGMYLSLRMIAALYRIIDLWYTIGTAYPRVIRGILVCGAMILAIGWLLDRLYRTAFVSGLLAYLLFYLSLYLLRYVVFRALQRPTTL